MPRRLHDDNLRLVAHRRWQRGNGIGQSGLLSDAMVKASMSP